MGAAWVRAIGLAAAVLLGTLAVSPAASAAPAAEPQTLQLGIGLPADSVQGRAVLDFAERVSRYTDGKLRVELHAGGSLGNDLTMLKALRENRLAMTAPDSSTLAPLEKAFSAINYPFTFFNEAEADAVLDGPWGQRLLDRLAQHGLVGLAYWENGFRHLTNQRRAIHSVADFAGLKMRTMQNPMLVDSFARLGFEPVPMPFPQVYEALRSQAVDGQENPLPTILSSRFYEVQKHLTLSRHIYSVHVLLIAKALWDSFDAPTQAALKKAALESRDVERRLSRAAAEKALAELQARGMQVTSIPRADAERIRNRLRGVFDKHNQDIGSTTVIDLYLELGRLRTAAPR